MFGPIKVWNGTGTYRPPETYLRAVNSLNICVNPQKKDFELSMLFLETWAIPKPPLPLQPQPTVCVLRDTMRQFNLMDGESITQTLSLSI